MPRWYCFEVVRHGRRPEYIGKAFTHVNVIRAHFPLAFIEGNLVTLYHRP